MPYQLSTLPTINWHSACRFRPSDFGLPSDFSLQPSAFSLLAQASPALWPTLERTALIVAIIGGIAGIIVARRKRQTNRIEPQPLGIEGDINVTYKGRRWSHEACEEKHATINRRLTYHDLQISELWQTMRKEDKETRDALSQAMRDFDRTIGEMHGTLAEVNRTLQMILKRELDK